MKRRMTQRPREEQALRCFPCPRSPTILICVVTVEFHPGDAKRLVGECSGEQISLWERTAKKKSYQGVVVAGGQEVSVAGF